MNKSEQITKFADKVEALAISMDINVSEFIYVLELLKHKKAKQILSQ